MNKVQIDGVEVLGLTINMFGEYDQTEDYDYGAVTLRCEDREFILDVCQTYRDESSGDLEVQCDLEIDKDIFEDCPYNITATDLGLRKVTAEFYINVPNEIDKMTLFVKSGGCTIAIDVEQE